MQTGTCKTCGKEFRFYPCQKKIYCNMKCYDKTGANNPKWNGGTYVLDGYIYQYAPDHQNATQLGYVAQHRLVVEKKIDRPLKKGEAVHHIDGNRQNNSIENLVVCVSNGKHYIQEHFRGRDKKGRFL